MAFAYARFIPSGIQYIASGTASSVYTHNTGLYTISYIRLIIIHNTNTTDETVALYNVPAGVAQTIAHRFYNELVSAGMTREMEFAVPGIMLQANNDAIYAVTTTANKVTIQMNGGTDGV